MTSMPIETVAQDIVDAIKPLLGERTINVMEKDGIIVASSDPARVGTLHHGALEAAATRRAVRIEREQVHAYPGAREGINLPVIKDGVVLGVVGIYGNPSEVEQSANLLGACVDLYLDQAFSNRKTQLRKEMLMSLMRLMLSGAVVDREEVLAAGRELRMDLRLPMRAIAVTPPHPAACRQGMEALVTLHNLAVHENWIDERRDVCSCLDGRLILVKYIAAGFDACAFAEKVHRAVANELGRPAGVGLGSSCEEWRQMFASHREASTLADVAGGRCLSIDSQSSKVLYLMNSCLAGGATDGYLRTLEDTLRRGFGAKDLSRVMKTIQAYCDADCRGGKAAETLGIHKNTMNYRMNKIVALLHMGEENSFVREFFLRLLVMRHNKHDSGF